MFSACRVRILESAFRQQCALSSPFTMTVALKNENVQPPKNVPKGFRAPGAFAIFFRDLRRREEGANMKLAAEKWGLLSKEQKDVYKAEKVQIAKEKEAEFRSKVAAEQNELVQQSVQKRQDKKQRSRRLELRKFNQQTNHPKRPANGFSLFVREKFQSVGKSTDRSQNIQVIYGAAVEWKQMSGSEKKPFVEQAKALQEQYKIDVEKWKELHEADRPKKVVKVRASRVAVKKARARTAVPKASKKARSSTKSKKISTKKH